MASPQPPTTVEPSSSYTDPTFSLLNTSCLDLLLIELVPMAYRINADLAAREDEWIHGSSAAAKSKRHSGTSNDVSSTAAGTLREGAGTDGGPVGGTATLDEEDSREAVFHRLESLGYRVGLGVVERYVQPIRRNLFPHALSFLARRLASDQSSYSGSHAMRHARPPPWM